MPTIQKNHPPSLKAKVAVEAIKGHKTASQVVLKIRSGRRMTGVCAWSTLLCSGVATSPMMSLSWRSTGIPGFRSPFGKRKRCCGNDTLWSITVRSGIGSNAMRPN
jgi:hypothetical protein